MIEFIYDNVTFNIVLNKILYVAHNPSEKALVIVFENNNLTITEDLLNSTSVLQLYQRINHSLTR